MTRVSHASSIALWIVISAFPALSAAQVPPEGSAPDQAAEAPAQPTVPVDPTAPADPATPEALEAPATPEPAAPVATTAAPAPAGAEANALSVKYDKGLSIQAADGEYALKLSVRSHLRADILRPEQADEFQTRFFMPRVRLVLEGNALGAENTYKFEFDVSSSGNPSLKDYFVNHAFSPGLHIRLGQWKRPFSRQELVSDFASEFVERSIANDFAVGGRDLGLAIHNNYEKSPDGLEWALAVFNGTGERARQTLECRDSMDITTCTPTTPSTVPADFGPMFVARVGWNMGGIKGYSEGDLEGGPLRLAVGASYRTNLQDLAEDSNGDMLIEHAATVDFLLKAYGFDLSGAAYMTKRGSADALFGLYGQAGIFVLPTELALAGRFSMHQIPASAALPDDELRLEAAGAIDWYLQGQSLKWLTDAGIVHATGDEGTTDVRLRTQLQFVF